MPPLFANSRSATDAVPCAVQREPKRAIPGPEVTWPHASGACHYASKGQDLFPSELSQWYNNETQRKHTGAALKCNWVFVS